MTATKTFGMTRRELGRTVAALATLSAAGALPLRAAETDPVVWYADAVTPENLRAIYAKLAGEVKGRVGIKIHGGEAAVNLDLWRSLQGASPSRPSSKRTGRRTSGARVGTPVRTLKSSVSRASTSRRSTCWTETKGVRTTARCRSRAARN